MKSACEFLRKTATSLAVSGISLFMGAGAWANGVSGSANLDYFELSAEQLFSAEVTSVTKTPQSVLKSPAAIYVLSNEDIIRSGATSIPEVLRMVPGVHVARTNSHSWAIGIRGFNQSISNKLLVLMDGRTLYNPLFSGVYWDVQDYVLEDIERIEVIRGPGASLWGANAVNGVINIITKKAEDTQGNVVTAGIGNEERFFSTARHGGEMQNGKGFYRFYGKFFDRDAQRASGGGAATDDWKAYRGGFRVDVNEVRDARDSVTVQGDVYKSDADYTGELRDFANLGPAESRIASKGFNVLGKWERRLGDDSALNFLSYVDYAERSQIELVDERIAFDAELHYEMAQAGRHKLNMGTRYRLTRDELSGVGDGVVTFNPASRNDQVLSAFIQDKITLKPEEWYLTLGSKFGYNDYTGFEVQPNARLQWHPDDQQTLWASISRAVRIPSRLEHDLNLVAGVVPTGGLPLEVRFDGNPNYDSEELVAYEMGYRRVFTPDFSLDTTVFYNVYDQLAINDIQTPFPAAADGPRPARLIVPLMPQNNMTGETYGFETALDWRVNNDWRLAGSYSLLDMQLHSAGSFFGGNAISAEGEEDEAPHHMFSIQSLYSITDNVTYDTYLYYVDSLQGHQANDYVRLDMRLGWRINDSLHFNLVGQNLLDDAHREFSQSVSSTEIQRSIYAKVVWQF